MRSLAPSSLQAPTAGCLYRPRPRPARTAHRCVVRAAATAGTEAAPEALSVLKAAVATQQVPPKEVFTAMLALEKAKLEPEGWETILGGTRSPGNRWRLVFTSGAKLGMEQAKSAKEGNFGRYFPVTAVQRWDSSEKVIQNGLFFGWFAALTFKGPYTMSGRKLYFDFDTLCIKLGPGKWDIKLKDKIDPSTFKPAKDLPFFIFSYVGEDMIVARGRSGGLAVWARTTPSWELKNGVA